ncbi:MAG: glycosyltransferase [Oscillospiraceae bacterium]|nr:glycosyltransferase [Oscillospiraceae bacterium]
MEKISVIIPAYNVEAYIRKCLDSVIKQTHENLEILLINDGSIDNSGLICDEYAAKDNRIKVFHKENGGLSTALNIGLSNFTGDYLGFVDSDDRIEPDMYKILLRAAKRECVPISVAGYYKATETGSTQMTNRDKIPCGEISTENMLLYPLKRDSYMGFCGYVWNKLYCAEIIKTSGLYFDEKIRYGMDVLFYISLVSMVNSNGIYTDKPIYHYFQRDTAISKTESVDIMTDIVTVYKRVEHILENSGYSHISYWARGFYCHHAGVVVEAAYKNNDEKTLTLMQNEIRKHIDDYIKTNKEFPDKIERMRSLLDLEVK